MIDFAAAVNVFAFVDLEECDTLVAALQKALPISFVLDLHAEEVDIEFSRAREIFDVKNHVVDSR